MKDVVNQIFESPVFTTQRMVIGRWHVALASSAFQIYGDPQVTDWLGGKCESSVESMSRRIQELIDRNNKWPDHFGSWPAFCKHTRELVGAMLMKTLPDADGNFTSDIEIGWHLARKHWGKGYATEGGRRMLQIAFDDLNLNEVFAVTNLDNVKSQSVAKRVGLEYVGETDAYYGLTLALFKAWNPKSDLEH